MAAMKINKILCWITVLLVVVIICIAVIAAVTEGFTRWNFSLSSFEKMRGFALFVDDKQITSETVLPANSSLKIEVRGAEEFKVRICPNPYANFDFKSNGVLVKFPYIDSENIERAFSLEMYSNGFSLNTLDKNMQHILSKIYGDAYIEVVNELDSEFAYFVLIVDTSQTSIEIPLTGFISGIELSIDNEEVIFG